MDGADLYSYYKVIIFEIWRQQACYWGGFMNVDRVQEWMSAVWLGSVQRFVQLPYGYIVTVPVFLLFRYAEERSRNEHSVKSFGLSIGLKKYPAD